MKKEKEVITNLFDLERETLKENELDEIKGGRLCDKCQDDNGTPDGIASDSGQGTKYT